MKLYQHNTLVTTIVETLYFCVRKWNLLRFFLPWRPRCSSK